MKGKYVRLLWKNRVGIENPKKIVCAGEIDHQDRRDSGWYKPIPSRLVDYD
jgi:hypothetical protein